MSALARFFSTLNGTWEFARVIHGSANATAQGTAVFTPHHDTEYLYREEGDLILPHGVRNPFFRHYVYRLSENYMDVIYGDGPQQGEAYQSYVMNDDGTQILPLSTHLCSADCYRGMYTIINENAFSLTTSVKGPHKNYTIKTDYVRI